MMVIFRPIPAPGRTALCLLLPIPLDLRVRDPNDEDLRPPFWPPRSSEGARDEC
ncbi:hypothetical protein DICSQDRAFT_135329 [Dichomitus squalens LYAD-421 SS1]|uniref:uncharacterized protein n=1 Tax=Dichomitus squalens (strain LYAD-421) TaxID=732165 RepID=UPI000441427D|nr:uncharacterized protein DICSQDRAFT_135329 [Dichomitus squalens LYAD-421 SS1]EJF63076.1 hypothetical protein DICSQDRAFT_135329 [Dichomitus squalens LYAD-421 SS1]